MDDPNIDKIATLIKTKLENKKVNLNIGEDNDTITLDFTHADGRLIETVKTQFTNGVSVINIQTNIIIKYQEEDTNIIKVKISENKETIIERLREIGIATFTFPPKNDFVIKTIINNSGFITVDEIINFLDNVTELKNLISKINASSSSVSSTTTASDDEVEMDGGRRTKKIKRSKTKKKMASWKIAQDKFKKKSLRTKCGKLGGKYPTKKTCPKECDFIDMGSGGTYCNPKKNTKRSKRGKKPRKTKRR